MVQKTKKIQVDFLDIRSSNAYRINEKSIFGPALKVNILTSQKNHEMRSWTLKMIKKKKNTKTLKNEALGFRTGLQKSMKKESQKDGLGRVCSEPLFHAFSLFL